MNNFRELKVWQKSVAFVIEIYQTTNQFPEIERFNLISQMQRCGTSIPSNIAEGAGRASAAYFKQFLTVALGSAYELETQLIISNKLSYISNDKFEGLAKEVRDIQRMLSGLINTL